MVSKNITKLFMNGQGSQKLKEAKNWKIKVAEG